MEKISSYISNSHSYNICKAYVQENPASIPNTPNRQGAKYTQKRIKIFFDFLLALLEPKWPSLRFFDYYKISSYISNSHSYNIC